MMAGVMAPLMLMTLWAAPLGQTQPAPENAQAEKVVTGAGIKIDGDTLLAFLKRRTLSESERRRLAALVRQLGDSSYEVRTRASADLTAAGVNATRFLKPALDDPDLEIARRAERCLEILQRGPGPELSAAVARLVGSGKPPGAVEVLLGYVPFADDETVEEAVLAALVEAGLHDGRADALVLTALTDTDPERRAAAAFVVGQATDPGQRRPALRSLVDPEVKVRFQAARTLFAAGEKEAVPALIALLTEGTPEIAWEAEELLCRINDAGGPGGYLDTASEQNRRQCRAAWESWWKTHEGKFDPARARLGQRLLGLTVIADLDKGTVLAVDSGRKERWRISGFGGPVDLQVLPNGNVLVAENHGRKVTERDRTGKLVWEKSTLTLPASCQRLPNGNTFIATYNQLLEVAPDGRETQKIPRPEGIYCARKLRNGHVVLATAVGKIVDLDQSGKEIRSFDTGGVVNWSSLEALPNGHILACCNPGKVVEFDAFGKRVWECAVPNAVCAQRLPNGNTLVCSSEGHQVLEVDRTGKEIWVHKTEGRPWHVRRR